MGRAAYLLRKGEHENWDHGLPHGDRMTAREAKQLLGATASLDLGELTVSVKILDIREVYGRVDFLVTPIAGSGQVWKAESSVKVQKGGSK